MDRDLRLAWFTVQILTWRNAQLKAAQRRDREAERQASTYLDRLLEVRAMYVATHPGP